MNITQPMFNIWSGDLDNEFQTIELNRESRKYIKVRLNNVIMHDESKDKNNQKLPGFTYQQ